MQPKPTLKAVTEPTVSTRVFITSTTALSMGPVRQRPTEAGPGSHSELDAALQQAAAFRQDIHARAHTPFRSAPGWVRGGLNE